MMRSKERLLGRSRTGMLSIKSSLSSLQAQRMLDRTSDQLARVYERLSSGQRINRASDDAAGLAVSSKLAADARIYTQAMRNVNDAVSAFAIADGTLEQGTTILTRLRELATQAANGSFSITQRRSLNNEAQELREEFNRIFASTSFNGQTLLDGSLGDFNVQNGREGSSHTSFRLGSSVSHYVGTGGYEADGSSVAFAGALQGTNTLAGDFDGDGDSDLISISDGRIYRNDGQGNFTAGTGTGISTVGSAREAMDVNGDGKLDLVYTNSNNLYYKAGNGDGTFGSARLIANGTDTELGDFDGDGDLDAVGVGLGGYVAISTNNNGTFSVSATYLLGGSYTFLGVQVGDVNSDGNLDVIANESGGQTYLLQGAGNGTLGSATAFDNQAWFNTFYFADVNGDGINDYIRDANTVRLGLGGGQFGADIASASGLASPNSFLLRDANNDGLLDLTDYFGNVAFGTRDGTFVSGGTSNLPIPGTQSSSAFSDFNGDGVLDWVYGDLDDSAYHFAFSSSERTGNLHNFSLSTRADALSSMSTIDAALLRVQRERGELGASQSRLSSTLSVLAATRENYLDARSRIMDADMAQESAHLIRLQILRQAGAAVLSQANQSPALALTLLAS